MHNTLLVLIFFALVACQQAPQNKQAYYNASIEQSVRFFDKAYHEEEGFYYSEVNHLGHVESERIHTVALSRMIYGLAYASEVNPDYGTRAEQAAAFQLRHMIGEDKDGLYYIPSIGEGEAKA